MAERIFWPLRPPWPIKYHACLSLYAKLANALMTVSQLLLFTEITLYYITTLLIYITIIVSKMFVLKSVMYLQKVRRLPPMDKKKTKGAYHMHMTGPSHPFIINSCICISLVTWHTLCCWETFLAPKTGEFPPMMLLSWQVS